MGEVINIFIVVHLIVHLILEVVFIKSIFKEGIIKLLSTQVHLSFILTY